MMRILVSGGGTAGHISPILATVDALKSLDKDVEILYVGQTGSLEAKIVANAGIEFVGISAGKYRRYHGTSLGNKITDLSTIVLNVRDAVRLAKGIIQSFREVKRFKPDVAFIKGGYVGLPVGLVCGWQRVPYVIHESDIVPGLTNRRLSRRAAAIATGFPTEKYHQLPQNRLHYTGNPVRRVVSGASPVAAKRRFKLDPALPVILVTGGSQGAALINDAVVRELPQLLQKYQLLHLTGEREIERVRFDVKRLQLEHPERYHAIAFLNAEMGEALAAADLVISRAGANTIAELAMLGKAVVLIPNAKLTADHQTANATMLSRQGAVRVIQEDRLRPGILASEISRVLDDPAEKSRLEQHLSELARPEAAHKLAQLIMSAAGERA